MNYKKDLQASLQYVRMGETVLTDEKLLQNEYEYEEELLSPLSASACLHLMGGGEQFYDFPFSISCRSMPCLLLISTVEGAGRITARSLQMRQQSAAKNSVSTGEMMLWDCRTPFYLQTQILPWRVQLYYVSGGPLDLYRPGLPFGRVLTRSLLPSPDLEIDSLRAFTLQIDRIQLLRMHRSLTNLLTDLSIADIPEAPAKVQNLPFYLQRMHEYITYHSNLPFSLAQFEGEYQVSRYRLCREYSSAYGISPLQDYNRTRIERAKKLLLTTDLQVQEISSSIGFENVSHFVTLFKRSAGMTPGSYRRKNTHSL